MKFEFDKLQEVADIVDSLHKTPTYSKVGKPVVRCTDVKYGRLDVSKAFLVDESTFAEFNRRYKAKVNDIIITRVGSYGNTAFVTNTEICLGQNVAAIIPKINARYLYLVLNSRGVKNQIDSAVVGSTQKTLSLKAISNLEIPRFGDKAEAVIAKTLGEIDDKIELNRQTNQTLEQIAQALFKSWFVDFEPTRAKIAAKEAGASPEEIERAAMCAISGKSPDQLAQLPPETQQNLKTTAALFPDALVDSELGEVPEGWVVESLDKFIDVKHGFAFQGEFFTDVDTHKILLSPGNFKIGGGFKLDKFKYYSGDVPEDYILKKRDLLITMTDLSKEADTLGFPALIPEHDEVIFLHNQRLGKVIGKHEQLRRYFFYCLFRSQRYREEIISGITGTTVKHTAPRKILAFTHPFCQELEKVFDDFASKIFSNIECLELQNNSLKTLRDTLLPKLLSGEIQLQNNEETINV